MEKEVIRAAAHNLASGRYCRLHAAGDAIRLELRGETRLLAAGLSGQQVDALMAAWEGSLEEHPAALEEWRAVAGWAPLDLLELAGIPIPAGSHGGGL